MAEYNYRKKLARRRRMRRIKKVKLILLILSVLMMTGSGVLLIMRVQNLEKCTEDMAVQIEKLAETVAGQQKYIDALLESAALVEDATGSAISSEQVTDVPTEQKNPLSEATQQPMAEGQQESGNTQETVGIHKVYLTFDDGPSTNTDDILDILERYDVKATFFVVGKEEEYAKEMLRQIADAGHTVGLHSYSHDYNTLYHSVENFAEDFEKQQEFVYEVTGQTSLVYRFPGGSSNTISEVNMQEFVDYLQDEGVEYYDWNASVGDGGSNVLDVDSLVSNAVKGITSRGTTILLMHDAPEKPTTVEALPKIIEKIQAMEDTILLPITEDTFPVHHLDE